MTYNVSRENNVVRKRKCSGMGAYIIQKLNDVTEIILYMVFFTKHIIPTMRINFTLGRNSCYSGLQCVHVHLYNDMYASHFRHLLLPWWL